MSKLFGDWRRGRDSNPRWTVGPYRFSRPAYSTTLAPLPTQVSVGNAILSAHIRAVQSGVANRNSSGDAAVNLSHNNRVTYSAIIRVGSKQINKWQPHRLHNVLVGLAAMFVAVALLGCQRCEDRGPIAMQAMLPQLDQAVLGKLVREASQCISNAAIQSEGQPYYMPSTAEAPVARGLKPVASAVVKYNLGPDVVVHNRGPGAPYMSVRVPVQTGAGLCLWGVYVCIKPGGGFAMDGNDWILEGRDASATPVVKLSDEVLVYADRRNM
jgi:hypothetical protein